MAALVEFISDRVLSSCKSACKEDPKLRSYISALRERMDKLMEIKRSPVEEARLENHPRRTQSLRSSTF
uniref:Isoform 2 of UPF0496 protein At3g48650 n=1 Tax=Arabidopsis thaliana TaxID=3702 RepID=Q9SMN4-2|nr:unknown protein [Arabidopsis thaliana]